MTHPKITNIYIHTRPTLKRTRWDFWKLGDFRLLIYTDIHKLPIRFTVPAEWGTLRLEHTRDMTATVRHLWLWSCHTTYSQFVTSPSPTSGHRATPILRLPCRRVLPSTPVNSAPLIKAKIKAISSDTHQLQLMKLLILCTLLDILESLPSICAYVFQLKNADDKYLEYVRIASVQERITKTSLNA